MLSASEMELERIHERMEKVMDGVRRVNDEQSAKIRDLEARVRSLELRGQTVLASKGMVEVAKIESPSVAVRTEKKIAKPVKKKGIRLSRF